MSIICNEHVNCTWLRDVVMAGVLRSIYEFTPDEGYALWRDNEEGNIDPETGEPWCYWFSITITDAEEYAPHIWAKFIDETMEVFGKTEQEQPEVAMFRIRRGDSEETEQSHTYIDENGVEREKKGVY